MGLAFAPSVLMEHPYSKSNFQVFPLSRVLVVWELGLFWGAAFGELE